MPDLGSPEISNKFFYNYFIYKQGSLYIAESGNSVTPYSYNSNTDFKTIIQNIVNGISPAGTPTSIKLGVGDFNLDTQFAMSSSSVGNITFEGMGMGLTNIIITSNWNGIALNTEAIKFGSYLSIVAGNTGTLTANCVLNAATVTVSTTDAAKFSVGDYILLTSTLAWSTAPSAGSTQAEAHKITAINTGTGVISLDVPTFDAYATANGAKIYKLPMMYNVKLSNLTIKKGSGLNTDLTNATGVTFFSAINIDNFQIENCQFIDPVTNYDGCCDLKGCINSEANNLHFIMNPTNTYNLQYGIAIGNCSQNIVINNSRSFGRFRHPFEGANDATTSGWQGIIRNVTFANCTAEGSEVACFDTHVGGEMISFVNCKALGSTITTGNVGFEIRTRKTQLIGCSAVACVTHGFQFSGDAHDGLMNGCKARACGGGGLGEGIRLINDMAGVKRISIVNCTFNDGGNNGIRCDSGCDYTKIVGCTCNNNANNGIYLKDSDYLLVTSNVVTNNGANGIWVDPTTLTLSNCQIIHNVTTGNTSLQVKTSSSSTGTFGSNNVVRDNTGFASAALGDLLKGNGTTMQTLPRGTANQVLAVNPAGTDIAWTSAVYERVGTATGSANGSATVFNIAHSIGSTPTYAWVEPYSVLGSTISYSYSWDATNIIVTFASAPASGTINFIWRVIP